MGQEITAEQALRELTRRGRIGSGQKSRSIKARQRASAERTLPLSAAALASIAGIDLSPVSATTAKGSSLTNEETTASKGSSLSSAAPIDTRLTVRLPAPFEWQAEALNAWAAQGHSGVVEAVTGAGKTAVGLYATAETLGNGNQVAIIVPTVALQEQWVASVRKAFPSAIVAQLGGASGKIAQTNHAGVIVAVVDSVRNGLKVPRPGLLIADEVHRYGSGQNARALNRSFSRRLGLTATYERADEGIDEHLTPYFGHVCFRLGYRRAIADGVLAPFRVGLLPVELPANEMAQYESLSRTMSGAAHDLEEHIGFREPFARFMKEVEGLAEGGGGSMTWTARRYLKAVSERRALLADTEARMDAFMGIVPLIKSSGQTLIFAERISQASALAAALSSRGIEARPIHSGLRLDERRTLLRSFGEGSIKAVTAPRVLDEGIDVPEADLAVVVSSTRTRRQMIQRMGRVIRRKADGREARLALIYVRDTTEDPERGAHDLFLDEVSEAASELRVFSSRWKPDEVANWFSAGANKATTENPPPKPRTSTIESQPKSVGPADSHDSDLIEELVREYQESHQMVSKSELQELRRQLPGWIREFRISTLKAAIRRGSTVLDVGATAGQIRAGIKALQEPKPKKPDPKQPKRKQVRKPTKSTGRTDTKNPVETATYRSLRGRKPNKRDKWVANAIGWDPQKVRNLRALFPDGRNVGSRPTEGTAETARQLGIGRTELDQWLRAETRADTRFKKQPGSVNARSPRRKAKKTDSGSAASRMSDGRATRAPVVPSCNACGRPISANGQCGCS